MKPTDGTEVVEKCLPSQSPGPQPKGSDRSLAGAALSSVDDVIMWLSKMAADDSTQKKIHKTQYNTTKE